MALRPSKPQTEEPRSVPLGGTRAESMQRLQVGASLLLGIILIVGLANVIEERAKQSDQAVVPEAAAKRCARTMGIAMLRIRDAWANRKLVICARDFKTLPRPAKLLVDHLRMAAE